MDAVLVDTNILVYAHDRSEPAKQGQAIEVLRQLQEAGQGYLSTQVLGEFYWAVTRGAAPKLTHAEAARQVERLVHAWPVMELTSTVVLEAIRGVREHQFSFWDAQVWATAKLNGIPTVYSEDFAVGSVVERVRFVNPFEAGERDE